MELLQYEFDCNKTVKENTSENVERILSEIRSGFNKFKFELDTEYFRNLRIDYFSDEDYEQTIEQLLEKIKIDLIAKTELKAIEFLAEFKDDESLNAEMKAA